MNIISIWEILWSDHGVDIFEHYNTENAWYNGFGQAEPSDQQSSCVQIKAEEFLHHFDDLAERLMYHVKFTIWCYDYLLLYASLEMLRNSMNQKRKKEENQPIYAWTVKIK